MCFGNFIQISLVSLGQRQAEIARAGCQGYINLKSCYKIRNTNTIISFAFLIRVTIHFYQSRRFIRSHFCHKAGTKWSKISETKGNAEQNMEGDRAKFAGKISKRPEQIWARPNAHPNTDPRTACTEHNVCRARAQHTATTRW